VRGLQFKYPFSPRDAIALFRRYFGPIHAVFARLDATGQDALERELVQLWTENNLARDGSSEVHVEYLEVIATKAD
jgi:hypothetical protein